MLWWGCSAVNIVCTAASVGEKAPVTKKLPSATTVSSFWKMLASSIMYEERGFLLLNAVPQKVMY